MNFDLGLHSKYKQSRYVRPAKFIYIHVYNCTYIFTHDNIHVRNHALLKLTLLHIILFFAQTRVHVYHIAYVCRVHSYAYHAYMPIHTCAHVSARAHTHMHTHTQTHIYIHTHTHLYTHIHTHTHTYDTQHMHTQRTRRPRAHTPTRTQHIHQKVFTLENMQAYIFLRCLCTSMYVMRVYMRVRACMVCVSHIYLFTGCKHACICVCVYVL